MESVTIKMHGELAREMESVMKHRYTTKTEFIRDAIRDKIKNEISTEEALRLLRKNFGASKKKVTYADERRAREEVGREIAAEFGLKLD